jgi:hypothetical protein
LQEDWPPTQKGPLSPAEQAQPTCSKLWIASTPAPSSVCGYLDPKSGEDNAEQAKRAPRTWVAHIPICSRPSSSLGWKQLNVTSLSFSRNLQLLRTHIIFGHTSSLQGSASPQGQGEHQAVPVGKGTSQVIHSGCHYGRQVPHSCLSTRWARLSPRVPGPCTQEPPWGSGSIQECTKVSTTLPAGAPKVLGRLPIPRCPSGHKGPTDLMQLQQSPKNGDQTVLQSRGDQEGKGLEVGSEPGHPGGEDPVFLALSRSLTQPARRLGTPRTGT